eukprot:m.181064 g.181064  ORF g.181064 m.181064 type:complete len:1330 (+) comp18028_c0_seq2:308-4297(+)
MAASVLKFVRGVDLSGTNFSAIDFPKDIEQLSNVRWLRLDRTGLDALPTAVNRLDKLESLSLEHCQLLCIPPSVKHLRNLRVLRIPHNDLSEADIARELMCLEDLTTVDLSHNRLGVVPPDLSLTESLIVCCLDHNQINTVPREFLIHCTDLEHLDLSANKIMALPPALRRLAGMRTLILSDNPLSPSNKLLSLWDMEKLTRLELRNCGRTVENLTPPDASGLAQLEDLDVGCNGLTTIPDVFFELGNLRRLNLMENTIEVLPPLGYDRWAVLDTLNLSRNKLKSLPESLCQLVKLRRLFVNSNELTALPDNMHKLQNMEHLQAGFNQLTEIPSRLCGCVKLTKLHVPGNKLKTLPQGIYKLKNLKDIKTLGNVGFRMPVRPPPEVDPEAEHYFVDFSQQIPQKKVPRGPSLDRVDLKMSPTRKKDTPKRKARMSAQGSDDGQKIMQGLKDIAAQPKPRDDMTAILEQNSPPKQAKPAKKWAAGLSRPDIDYGEVFEDDVGDNLGLTVWRMENFLPCIIPVEEHGRFYECDCYIVLSTTDDEDTGTGHEIYFWIGGDSSLDKKASAAIHAVNLRNFLGATSSTHREEMDDESDEFMELFDDSISYIQGGTDTGFFEIVEQRRPTRLFLLQGKTSLTADAVALTPSSLDSSHVYMLDADEHDTLYIWRGAQSKAVQAQKALLFAEKACKQDEETRKRTTLVECREGEEPEQFLQLLGEPNEELAEHNGAHFPVKLHEMTLGDGFLELPQLAPAGKDFDHDLLRTNGVYIVDAYSDLYVWIGRKSSRLVRAAAHRMATELEQILKRPPFFLITRVSEGNEPQVFKSKFSNWNDVVAVDYRARDVQAVEHAVAERERMTQQALFAAQQAEDTKNVDAAGHKPRAAKADVKVVRKWEEPKPVVEPPKVDVLELFSPQEEPMATEEAELLEAQWEDELEKMEAFYLQGSNFVRMPPERLGHFYSADCYVFLCTQWRQVEPDPSAADDSDSEAEEEEVMECVAYFWQGRNANQLGWLTFSFSTRSQMERLVSDKLGCELNVVREQQQQESMRFMSLFHKKMTVHNGKFADASKAAKPRLYRMYSWEPTTFTRTVEVPLEPRQLHTSAVFVLKVPFDGTDDNGIIYVWAGAKAPSEHVSLAKDVASCDMWENYTVQVVEEGREPQNFFWSALAPSEEKPGSHLYNSELDIGDARLFLCSNKAGYFCVKEKRPDFCQDDLDDHMTAILDNGDMVYLWKGPLASDVVLKLSTRAAQEYVKRLPVERGLDPSAIPVCTKTTEPFGFQRAFHGWLKPLEKHKDLGRPVEYLGNVLDVLYGGSSTTDDGDAAVAEGDDHEV